MSTRRLPRLWPGEGMAVFMTAVEMVNEEFVVVSVEPIDAQSQEERNSWRAPSSPAIAKRWREPTPVASFAVGLDRRARRDAPREETRSNSSGRCLPDIRD
jgi:hypothetical protein